MKEEFQQPKRKDERRHILQKQKIKARHKWCLALMKDEDANYNRETENWKMQYY